MYAVCMSGNIHYLRTVPNEIFSWWYGGMVAPDSTFHRATVLPSLLHCSENALVVWWHEGFYHDKHSTYSNMTWVTWIFPVTFFDDMSTFGAPSLHVVISLQRGQIMTYSKSRDHKVGLFSSSIYLYHRELDLFDSLPPLFHHVQRPPRRLCPRCA
jgi:hypothetical protein